MMFDNLNVSKFKDKAVASSILKIIELFQSVNNKRAEEMKKFKSREGLIILLKDLANHVESCLVRKFSENFLVIITEHPFYCLKYDSKYFMAMKYGTFDIIIFKFPNICLPSMYSKLPDSQILPEE